MTSWTDKIVFITNHSIAASCAQIIKGGAWHPSGFMMERQSVVIWSRAERHTRGLFSLVLCLIVWSYCFKGKKKNPSQSRISNLKFSNWSMAVSKYRHCAVLFKGMSWLIYHVYIVVKLQTNCIFSSCFLMFSFFLLLFLLLLMTCVEYAIVTAPALVMGRSKQSHLDSWLNILLILWLKQVNARFRLRSLSLGYFHVSSFCSWLLQAE